MCTDGEDLAIANIGCYNENVLKTADEAKESVSTYVYNDVELGAGKQNGLRSQPKVLSL